MERAALRTRQAKRDVHRDALLMPGAPRRAIWVSSSSATRRKYTLVQPCTPAGGHKRRGPTHRSRGDPPGDRCEARRTDFARGRQDGRRTASDEPARGHAWPCGQSQATRVRARSCLIVKRVYTVRIRIRRSVTSWFVRISRTAICAVDALFTAFGAGFACSTKELVSTSAGGVRTGGA
jgi:hypothetical protein